MTEEIAQRMEDLGKFIDAGGDLSRVPVIALHNLYLVSSYLYYKKDHSLIADASFERICKELLRRWGEAISLIWHTDMYLQKEDLEAGTGFDLPPHDILDTVAEFLYNRRPR